MKKNLVLILSGLMLPAVYAGDPAPIADPVAQLYVSKNISNPVSITIQGGIMHTAITRYSDDEYGARDSTNQTLPSLLYGGTIGANWNFSEMKFLGKNWIHSLGASVGFYNGSESSTYTWDAYYAECIGEVTAIPITLAYNLKHEITDSFSWYFGARAGAMIRHSEYTITLNGERLPAPDSFDSTKVLPMVGLGIGFEVYLAERTKFNISYDLVWTMGDDCSVPEGYYRSDFSRKHRYYGTVGVGVTYSF